MLRRDTTDFVTAFGIGAVLGIGATLLLRPHPPPRAARILRELEPYRTRVRKRAKRAGRGLGRRADAMAERRGELLSAGRELLDEFRAELTELLNNAREEWARAVEDQVAAAQRAIRDRRRGRS